MTIRTEQMNALQQNASKRFIDDLMVHFSTVWPEQVKSLGAGYRSWVTEAVRSAEYYGIATQQLSARFVNLWFVWGRDFETKPGFEWAKEILDATARKPFVKLHQLSYRTRIELEAMEAELAEERLVA